VAERRIAHNCCVNFADVAAALGLHADGDERSLAALAAGWEASQANLPAGPPYFLDPAFVERACEASSIPAAVPAALGAARQIAGEPALAALAGHCYWALYEASAFSLPPNSPAIREGIRHWPLLRTALGEHAGLFYLLVQLAGLPTVEDIHRRHNVPPQVTRETLHDVVRWADWEYRAEQGEWGLYPKRLTWLRNHFAGELYHLVRLQFQFGRLWPGFRAFRHRQTGAVAALTEDGALVDPSGRVAAGMPALDPAEWEQVLAPGDPVLHLHIPSGSPMDFALCGDSLREAMRFFPRHFPQQPWAAFACSSWLLDPTLATFLPETSNIVQLQREVYLLPSASSGNSTMERVFGRVPATREELAALPRDTTLRRAIVDHLLAGGQIGSGRCFLFPRDFRWGAQVYRRARWPLAPAMRVGHG
jgi:hypothetical protein